MALHHAASGELVRLRPRGESLTATPTMALVKSEQLEIMRMLLTAGRSVPEHQVNGELSMQCLEGAVEVMAHDRATVLEEGDMMFLTRNVPHALRAVKDSVLLMTIALRDGTAESSAED
jgi:quercetin dioxygenase-like cupin family protein